LYSKKIDRHLNELEKHEHSSFRTLARFFAQPCASARDGTSVNQTQSTA
jgi:hypothetical protein